MEEEVHVREPCHLCDEMSIIWTVTVVVVAQIHAEHDYFIVGILFFLPNRTCCAEV
jgi:hypothetical protein